jgi:exopolyphosphatase/guanosine-5'-triphosphate,3'-diphosphate pyrophosphatase
MAVIIPRWEWRTFGTGLGAAEAPRVFDALGVLPPRFTRDAYSLGQFLAELVEPTGAVRAVRVHKRRVRYTLGGCRAEVADLEVGGRPARTIAIESEDASAVIAAVRGIGLDGHVNTSYPRGLAALGSEPPLAGEG